MRSIPDYCPVTELGPESATQSAFRQPRTVELWGLDKHFHEKRLSEMSQLNDTSGRFDMIECVLILISCLALDW